MRKSTCHSIKFCCVSLVALFVSCSSGGARENQPPNAMFRPVYDPVSNITLGVDASASTDPEGSPLTYEWSWGDGTPNSSGVTARHTYTRLGQFPLTLTVRDAQGALDSESQTLIAVLQQNGEPIVWLIPTDPRW